MAGDWPTLSLREAKVTLIDCDHRTPPASDAGYPYITIPQLRNGHIDPSDARRITREHFVEWTRKAKPSANDVVLSRRCNPGETAVVPPGLEFALGQNLVLLRADGTKIYPPFLRWLVRGPEWWEQIATFQNPGAVFDSLKCVDIPNFSLRIPPLDQQRAIAHVLGALDDKIELNRHMSRTLEATAQALFKSWFVDFDPVVSKAAGRQPFGMDAKTAALFPSRFVESELGPVPAGWRSSTIGAEVRVVGGSTPSTGESLYWGGTIRWLTPRDLSRLEGPIILQTERRITELGLARISSGLLPVGTVVLSSRAPIGYLAIANVPLAVNQGFVAMVCDRSVGSHYVFHWARENMDDVLSRAGGTTFAEISKASFRPIPILVPSDEILAVFEVLQHKWYSYIASNARENLHLASFRDALLPKLLSGEIRVKDGEREAERSL